MKREEQYEVVQIDELNLDKECIGLPAAFIRAAHEAADARRDEDEMAAALKVVEAEVDRDIRGNPAKYGLEKVTEGGISGALTLSKRVKEARKAHLDASHKRDLYQALVSALEHKKRALSLLVELHGAGYNSDVKVSKQGREAVEEMSKRRARHYRDDD